MPPTLLGVILLFTFPLSWSWTIAMCMTIMSARGTRARWMASTVERALRVPAILNRVLLVFIDVKMSLWGDMLFDSLALVIVLWLIGYRQGDDDDFWKGKGKKLWRSVTSSLGTRSFATGMARQVH